MLYVVRGVCTMFTVVRVLIGARIPEELRVVLQARARVEGRSFSNLVERLLELGLGVIGPVGPVPCARAAFHGTDECPECGWKPVASTAAVPVAPAVVSPVAVVPVREVGEHGWRGPDPKVKR